MNEPTNTWECGDCGATVERYRGEGDVRCSCGAEYNSFGQRLAPRSQWGEETGETYSDIVSGHDPESLGYPYEDDEPNPNIPDDDPELPDDPYAHREEMRRLHESQV